MVKSTAATRLSEVLEGLPELTDDQTTKIETFRQNFKPVGRQSLFPHDDVVYQVYEFLTKMETYFGMRYIYRIILCVVC